MIDAHAHLDRYGADLASALDEIRTYRIRTIAVSMDEPSFRENQRIAASEPLVLPSFGIHPWEAPRCEVELPSLDSAFDGAPLFGEIGLDHRFVRDRAQYPAQRRVFDRFLGEAERRGRTINVHSTGAEEEVLSALRVIRLPSILLHWYSGPLRLVDDFLALGAYFSIGVAVLQSKPVRALAAALPLDRILTETDNPGGWQWLRGAPGFPRLLADVEEAVAQIRGLSRESLASAVSGNFARVLAAGSVTMRGDDRFSRLTTPGDEP